VLVALEGNQLALFGAGLDDAVKGEHVLNQRGGQIAQLCRRPCRTSLAIREAMPPTITPSTSGAGSDCGGRSGAAARSRVP
jgi:hypothetical protein